MLKYGSVCSGIEAATVAWERLGWKPAFFSEIEKFPRAVLSHHYPDVPLHGDFTTIQKGDYDEIDLLVGGTPCQSFSIAGLRGGLDDDRGNLALEYLRLADRLKPRWIVWENVPGVLSSKSHSSPDQSPPDIDLEGEDGPEDGTEVVVTDEYEADEDRAFHCFLSGLQEIGYGFAYRVLDAQHVRVSSHPRGVPQRRRRVFVVGYLGDWRRAAAVLFEPESMRGDPPPRREAGKGVAPTISARPTGGGGLGTDFDLDGGLIPFDTTQITHKANYSRPKAGDPCHPLAAGAHVPAIAIAAHETGQGWWKQDEASGTLRAEGENRPSRPSHIIAVASVSGDVSHSLKAEGFDASEDGTGRADADIVAGRRVSCKDHGADASTGAAPTMRAMGHSGSHANAGGQLAVAFDLRGREGGAMPEGPHDTANIRAASGGSSRSYVAFDVKNGLAPHGSAQVSDVGFPLKSSDHKDPQIVSNAYAVRRLTPTECERLQGFPDGWTLVPHTHGKPAADGPRYKALGNSMAGNCMSWIGERIRKVDEWCALQDLLEEMGAFDDMLD